MATPYVGILGYRAGEIGRGEEGAVIGVWANLPEKQTPSNTITF